MRTRIADDQESHRDDVRRNVYDADWNLIDIHVTRPQIKNLAMSRPAALEAMVRCAEPLSEPSPKCRVDFDNPRGHEVIFGKIIFFHRERNNVMEPQKYQGILGDWIDLSQVMPTSQSEKP